MTGYMNRLVYLKDVATLKIDDGKCVGCGSCLTVCPHEVISMNGDKKAVVSHLDACMECGACANNCPAEAIAVQAGVGCAAAVINAALGKTDSSCCCSITDTGAKRGVGICGC